MRALPGLSDVNSDLQISSPMLNVDIDRDRASSLGVTEDQIENALYDAYGQRQVSTIYTSVDSYWVVMEVKPEFQRDPKALGLLYIRSSGGTLVPLNEVVKLSSRRGPAFHFAPGATAGHDDFVQPSARAYRWAMPWSACRRWRKKSCRIP